MNARRFLIVPVVVASLVLPPALHAQTPVGTAFIYQGQLKDGGVPANDEYDFIFRLFDDPVGGTQVGGDVEIDEWLVSDGLFTVELDFGTDVFTGDALWLDVSVRLDGGGEYTVLSPRQPLTATPYALYALSGPGSGGFWAADGDDIYNTNSGNVGIGTANPGSRLHVAATTASTAILAESGGAGYQCAVDAFVESPEGNAIYAYNEGWTGNAYGIVAETASSSGTAIYGLASRADLFDSSNIGVRGRSDGDSNAVGVYGEATNTNPDGTTYGVRGVSAEGTGVRGDNQYTGNYGTLGTEDSGAYGRAVGEYDVGMRGVHLNTGNYGSVGTRDAGVSGIASGTSGEYYGVYGTAPYAGVYGVGAGGVFASYGLVGIAEQADVNINYGVYARAENSPDYNFAGRFIGNVSIIGDLSKSGGSFEIDHPLDPANKYLRHSFVESPDMMNVYNGNAVTDANGYAEVTLPEWFETLNRDFRYQLTVIDETDNDTFVQAKVVRGIRDNRFRIRTSAPGTTVSWQVTGIRQDPWANAHRIQVEEEKREKERGSYLHPELYDMPPERRVDLWLEATAQPTERGAK